MTVSKVRTPTVDDETIRYSSEMTTNAKKINVAKNKLAKAKREKGRRSKSRGMVEYNEKSDLKTQKDMALFSIRYLAATIGFVEAHMNNFGKLQITEAARARREARAKWTIRRLKAERNEWLGRDMEMYSVRL